LLLSGRQTCWAGISLVQARANLVDVLKRFDDLMAPPARQKDGGRMIIIERFEVQAGMLVKVAEKAKKEEIEFARRHPSTA
jgi:hypothetical protein